MEFYSNTKTEKVRYTVNKFNPNNVSLEGENYY